VTAWTLLRIALSSAAAIAGGLPLVAPRGRPAAGDLAAAWTLALGNAAVLALAAGLAGMPLSAPAFLVLLIAPGAAAVALRRRQPRPTGGAGEPVPPGFDGSGSAKGAMAAGIPVATRPAAAESAPGRSGSDSALLWLTRIALACALAVLIWKYVQAPLWGWDHFAIWGVKARRMLQGGHLRLDFLASLYQTRTDHPLGIPMAWLVLTLGRAPTPAVFKLLHTLFALALVAILRTAVQLLTSFPALGNAAAAALAVSPLLWDTEIVGLCEVPLALWALAALLLLLPRAGEPLARRHFWLPSLAVGFLPWIKQEGLVLGLQLLLLGALLLARRGRRIAMPGLAQLAAPALLLMAGALAMQRFILPPGVSFFVGPWLQRGLARLPMTFAILRQCAGDLLEPDWLGFWILLTLATCVAAVTRKTLTLALAAVVWSQVLLYVLTAYFSYIYPPEHLRAAFFRICGPLVPIGLLAMAALLRNQQSSSAEESHPRALTEPDVRLSPHPALTIQPPVAPRESTARIASGTAERCAPSNAPRLSFDVAAVCTSVAPRSQGPR
jgi:hypothetical protein